MAVRRFRITVNGHVFEVEAEEINDGRGTASQGPSSPPLEPATVPSAFSVGSSGGDITAPLPGVVLDIKVRVGEAVPAGQILLILEAMKMENEIVAPRAGTVRAIAVHKGQAVTAGEVLVVLES